MIQNTKIYRWLPETVAIVVAMMWGLWWIPVRALNDLGFEGIWGGLVINSGASLVLLLIVLVQRLSLQVSSQALVGSLCIGFGVASYAAALSFTYVANAVLLFYLAPAWSTILECTFLGRKWRWQSLLAIGSSFTGMVLIFSNSMSLAEVKLGDIMALVSGIIWSIGLALVFSTETKGKITILSLYCMIFAVMVGLVVWLIGGSELGDLPTRQHWLEQGPKSLAIGAIYFTPLIILSIWTTTVIAPALMCFLLSFEIVSGIGSSAIILNEPFGLIQIAGSVCILLGALVEVLIPDRTKKQRKRAVETINTS
ncbi:MAG: DMT family transporter [Rhodobacteraceae bacterium]|nr:DMT family transporter [Paracoccaceae bacterium]